VRGVTPPDPASAELRRCSERILSRAPGEYAARRRAPNRQHGHRSAYSRRSFQPANSRTASSIAWGVTAHLAAASFSVVALLSLSILCRLKPMPRWSPIGCASPQLCEKRLRLCSSLSDIQQADTRGRKTVSRVYTSSDPAETFSHRNRNDRCQKLRSLCWKDFSPLIDATGAKTMVTARIRDIFP
jgi:hypothetical protein